MSQLAKKLERLYGVKLDTRWLRDAFCYGKVKKKREPQRKGIQQ